MSNPISVLESLRSFIVNALIAVPEFQPLTQWAEDTSTTPQTDADGNPISAILAMKKGDLLAAAQNALNRCGLSVAVLITSFFDDDSQSVQPQFNPVEITVEIAEQVANNQAGGTGLSALYVAERVVANLKELLVTGVDGCTAALQVAGPFQDTTSPEESAAGYCYFTGTFKTRAVAQQRINP